MTKIVQFDARPTKDDALAAARGLVADIENGKVVAFLAAALDESDATYVYVGVAKQVSRLRMYGAVGNAFHMFQHGEVE